MKAMLIVCGFYWLHLFAYPASMLHSLMHSVLSSMVIQISSHDGYLMWQGSNPEQRNLIYIFALILILGLVVRRSCSLILPLILCDLAAFLYFIVKGRGTSSDLLLLNVISVMLLPILYFSLVQTFRLKPIIFAKRLLTLGAIIVSGCFVIILLVFLRFDQFESLKHLGYFGYQNKKDVAPFADLIERNSKPGEPVLILTNESQPAYPALLQLKRMPCSYYLTGFPIFLLNLADEERAPKEWWQEDMSAVPKRLTCDLLMQRPALVLIESGPPWEQLGETCFGKALKEHYDKGSGSSLWEIDSLAKKSGYPIEYIGERRDICVYVKKKVKENL